MSILSSMRYCLNPSDSIGSLWAALAFMPFGLFFDFMDGKVARWRKKSSLMGQELDSLADLVSGCYIFVAFYRGENSQGQSEMLSVEGWGGLHDGIYPNLRIRRYS